MNPTDFQPAPHFHALPAKKRRKAPWIIAGAVGLLLIGAAGGAAGKDAPAPAPAANTAAPAPVAAAEPAPAETVAPRAERGQGAMPDDFYVNFVREHTTNLSAVTDDEIVGLALSTCGAFDRGGSKADIARAIINNSAPEMHPDMATIIGAGVRNYCPEYKFD